jgi:hypothetical protein
MNAPREGGLAVFFGTAALGRVGPMANIERGTASEHRQKPRWGFRRSQPRAAVPHFIAMPREGEANAADGEMSRVDGVWSGP